MIRSMHDPTQPVRVDRWLWAARLCKTRAIAVDAIKGGRVEVNGQAIKPSREVGPGDRLRISFGAVKVEVDIKATGLRRGSAADAAELYDETPESIAAREEIAAQRRADREAGPRFDDSSGRPTKRDRRAMERLRGRR
jgi:ribosome-associated heat shock protein Hsp15